MFEDRSIARHQRRCSKAEYLPEWEIPRHHREHDTQRVEGYEGLTAADVGRLLGKVFVRMVRKPVAIDRAFLDLRQAVVERLAHFFGHQPGELVFAGTQDLAGRPDHCGALAEACPPP